MSHASFFKVLGLATTAPEAAVRARFKVLALAYHPDKMNPEFKLQATARFCVIKEAYDYCLAHLDPNAEDDVDDDDDDEDWRGRLPKNIFNFNSTWWDGLKGDEPLPIKNWAEACQNAHRFANVRLDELTKHSLNINYRAAYENFEKWRRKHIERPQEEERLQQNINELPERLQAHARRALAEKRAAPDYFYDNYQEDHGEEQYFWLPDPAKQLIGTWRYQHNSLAGSGVTPQQRLAQFRHQVEALDMRIPTFGIELRTPAEVRFRRERRELTEARLVADVKCVEMMKREMELNKQLSQSVKSIDENIPLAEETTAALKETSEPSGLEESLKSETA
jgi:hypothetical protein